MNPTALPTFNVEAIVALQKANFETLFNAQQILVDAAQAASAAHVAWVKEIMEVAQSSMTGFDADKKPEAYFAEAKIAAEKAVAVLQTEIDLGLKAQNEVAELLTKRAAKNVDELQKLAA